MQDIIKKFKEIRDLKYQIPISKNELDFCCSGKMKLFKQWLDENGFMSRCRVCEFKWSDMDLPESVTSIQHEDRSTHTYLEVYIDNKWIDVDPTWDIQLKDILPVSIWDGKSSCQIAVPILKKYGETESEKIINSAFDENDILINGEFYTAFNCWLEQNRL